MSQMSHVNIGTYVLAVCVAAAILREKVLRCEAGRRPMLATLPRDTENDQVDADQTESRPGDAHRRTGMFAMQGQKPVKKAPKGYGSSGTTARREHHTV